MTVPVISLSTKSRILAAADELVTNQTDRPEFSNRRTRTIGIISFDLINNCFTRLVDAIEAEAKSRVLLFINLILTHKDPAHELEGLRLSCGTQGGRDRTPAAREG
jgi:DNA-binding LacI/PurR family transcriptional regulator